MTPREAAPPRELGGRLLFNNINHPRHAEPIADLSEAMRPEGLLPVHFDLSLRGKVIKTSAYLLPHLVYQAPA
ncbi:Uncharacterised protein [Salmonella enterica subsp. arizonae]|uniref:Uncharacterized protein n=1 Tax=Salmonella enterica subsp. arizonae TaxID=59203 RepID=A0A379THG1_SALER|nr:Uncharacterised protein [Salmonella enterica subsp. arizonae]